MIREPFPLTLWTHRFVFVNVLFLVIPLQFTPPDMNHGNRFLIIEESKRPFSRLCNHSLGALSSFLDGDLSIVILKTPFRLTSRGLMSSLSMPALLTYKSAVDLLEVFSSIK